MCQIGAGCSTATTAPGIRQCTCSGSRREIIGGRCSPRSSGNFDRCLVCKRGIQTPQPNRRSALQRRRYHVDKITILEIKETRLTSPAAIANVRRELAALANAAQDAHCNNADLAQVKAELRLVNEKLWDIEDRIRAKEATRKFDREFVKLARSVYFENDKRADLKGRINRLMNSEIVEEKQYARYDRQNDSSPSFDSQLV